MKGIFVLFLLVTLIQLIYSAPPGQKVANGVSVSPKDFPYFAYLLTAFKSFNGQCGASLISHNHVLTAAHCIMIRGTCERVSRMVVYLGSDIESKINHFEIRDYIIHEDYVKGCKGSIKADIAILTLAESVPFSRSIMKILLPPASVKREQIEGLTAVVSGFGQDKNGSLTKRLQAVNVTIGTKSFCEKKKVYGGFICSEIHNGRMDRKGDSGGPLVINNTLYGIVSGGPTELTAEYSKYTSIIFYRSWILKNVDIIE
ncbi:chymotrypsin-like [Anthonomus grandis grandis]|uniref:chymotrypsin-like n=1 Tax=Anthonomus grandis grandis TaxID=2921223 RepID=UPI002165E458|nr:chymotrypsin-like [Anthonomus grandis grandis]